jgi:hypothetical protein
MAKTQGDSHALRLVRRQRVLRGRSVERLQPTFVARDAVCEQQRRQLATHTPPSRF